MIGIFKALNVLYRKAYVDQPNLLRGYRVLARDALADDGALSAELALQATHSFVIRRDAGSSTLAERAIATSFSLRAADLLLVRLFRRSGYLRRRSILRILHTDTHSDRWG